MLNRSITEAVVCCGAVCLLAFAGPASAQTAVPPVAPTAATELGAFAPVPLESTLSLASLQGTPIAAWKMSAEDIDLHARAAMVPKPYTLPPASPVIKAQGKGGNKAGNPALRRTLAGIAGGFGGFFAGGIIGARIEGQGCDCDDPGLLGAVIGAPIGAAVGAILGVWFAR